MTNNEAISYLIEAYAFCSARYCPNGESAEWEEKLEKFREAISHVATNLNTSIINWRDYPLARNDPPVTPMTPYVTYCNSSRGISEDE